MASVHEKKMPFICEICEYRCSHRWLMKSHMASVHEKKRSFKCELCDFSSSSMGNMKKHVAQVHEKKGHSSVNLVIAVFLKRET